MGLRLCLSRRSIPHGATTGTAFKWMGITCLGTPTTRNRRFYYVGLAQTSSLSKRWMATPGGHFVFLKQKVQVFWHLPILEEILFSTAGRVGNLSNTRHWGDLAVENSLTCSTTINTTYRTYANKPGFYQKSSVSQPNTNEETGLVAHGA